MTKQYYAIAAVCLWLLSAFQSTYKYEAGYVKDPVFFDMPMRVEAPEI